MSSAVPGPVCVGAPRVRVCLSYVQPSSGKTFAYLRSSPILVAGQEARTGAEEGGKCEREVAPSRHRCPRPRLPRAVHRAVSYVVLVVVVVVFVFVDRRPLPRSVRHSTPRCRENETSLKKTRGLSRAPVYLSLYRDPTLPPSLSASSPYRPTGINRLSGELNLSDGAALSNAPT